MTPLERAAIAYLKVREEQERSRTALHKAIVSALRAGVPQHEICDVTGYSRETVRQIRRSG